MNPVKWVIFLISLFFVTGIWHATLNKVFPKSKFTILVDIAIMVEFGTLTYMIPYATWWLLHIWRW